MLNTKTWYIGGSVNDKTIVNEFLMVLCDAIECYNKYYKVPIETKTFQSEVPQFNTSSENWCRKVDWKISKNGESSFGETTVCRNELDGSWSPIFPLGEM